MLGKKDPHADSSQGSQVIRQTNGGEILEEASINITIISLQVWCEGADRRV